MRLPVLCVTLIAMCALAVPAFCAASTEPVAAAKPAVPEDARLKTPVTYQAQDKRLHTVCDDLRQMTGVTIRSGNSEKDWQVRDIPMTLFVKDLPLGDLLRSLADAAHLMLSTEPIKADNGGTIFTYRLWRDSKMRRQIDDYLDANRKANIKRVSLAWDTLSKLADTPESSWKPDPKMGAWQPTPQQLRALGKLLAALGPDARDKLLSEGRLTVSAATFSQPDLVTAVYKAARSRLAILYASNADSALLLQPPSPEEEKAATVTFNFSMPDDGGYTSANVSVGQIRTGENSFTSDGTDLTQAAYFASRDVTGKPPDNPGGPGVTSPDSAEPGLTPLQLQAADLARKIKLELPKDTSKLTWGDYLKAIAQGFGANIVVEDFYSHLSYPMMSNRFSSAEVTLADAMRMMSGEMWYARPPGGVIVGQAQGWITHHLDLAPESVLANLKHHAETDGIVLDDVLPLLNFTQGQFREWIAQSRDLFYLSSAEWCGPWCHLFARLAPEDRARAQTDAGLPLAGMDTVWIRDFLADSTRGRNVNQFVTLVSSDPAANQEYQERQARERAVMSDPAAIGRLTLRVTAHPARGMQVMTRSANGYGTNQSYEQLPEGYQKTTYYVEVRGESGGKPVNTMESGPSLSFPVYTPEREQVLLQAYKEKNKPAADGRQP